MTELAYLATRNIGQFHEQRRNKLLRHESFCLVGGNLRAQQGHRGRARASATISR